MLITVFVFLGIEGASVYSRFARKREDIGKATVFGFLGSAWRFRTLSPSCPTVSCRSAELANCRSALDGCRCWNRWSGHWGAIFIRIGVILSVLGAYLAWTLMAAEILSSRREPTTCRDSSPREPPMMRLAGVADGHWTGPTGARSCCYSPPMRSTSCST